MIPGQTEITDLKPARTTAMAQGRSSVFDAKRARRIHVISNPACLRPITSPPPSAELGRRFLQLFQRDMPLRPECPICPTTFQPYGDVCVSARKESGGDTHSPICARDLDGSSGAIAYEEEGEIVITLIYYIVVPIFHASNLRPILRPIYDPCGAVGGRSSSVFSRNRPPAIMFGSFTNPATQNARFFPLAYPCML